MGRRTPGRVLLLQKRAVTRCGQPTIVTGASSGLAATMTTTATEPMAASKRKGTAIFPREDPGICDKDAIKLRKGGGAKWLI